MSSPTTKTPTPTLEELIGKAPPPTQEALEALEALEAQRRSFAYANLRLDGVEVTRQDIDRAAERLDKERTP